MKTLIVTGGIATGKSTFIRLLMEEGGARLRLFDCDAEAGRLLDGGTLKAPLSSVFGPASVDSSGKADRHFCGSLFSGIRKAAERWKGSFTPCCIKNVLRKCWRRVRIRRWTGLSLTCPCF